MPDNIFEMEKKLQEMRNKYRLLEERYQTITSESGVAFSLTELATLSGIKSQIEVLMQAMKDDIARQERRIKEKNIDLETLTMQKVINKYDGIHKEMIKFLGETIDDTYHEWIIHIKKVTDRYRSAENSHKALVNGMDKHQAAIVEAGNLLLSIMGMNLTAWFNTSKELTNVLKGIRTATGTRKGVVKGAWNQAKKKTMAEMIGSSASISREVDDSLRTLLKLDIKLEEYYKEIRESYWSFIKEVTLYHNYAIELDLRNEGNPLEELKGAYSVEDDMKRVKKNIENCISKVVLIKNYDKVEDDFKRLFWSLWIPKLQTARKDEGEEVLEYLGVIDEAPIYYNAKNWFWTQDFINEMTRLVVTDGSLQDGVSEEEAQKLIEWAKNFTPTQVF